MRCRSHRESVPRAYPRSLTDRHAYTLTCLHAYTLTCVHAYMLTCLYMLTRLHAYMLTCLHAYTLTCLYMLDLSSTLCRGFTRQVLATVPLHACLNGHPVVAGLLVPTGNQIPVAGGPL